MLETIVDQAVAERDGEQLPLQKLNTYLNHHIAEFGEISEIRQFPGGYSNLTYLIKAEEKYYVLRKPPAGANIKSAHDMGREFKVLSLLKTVYPLVPSPIYYNEDEEVLGAPFYIMERVKGVIIRNKIPAGLDLNEGVMRKISEATVDNLVKLHSIDITQPGFIDLGKPEGYNRRQVEGWIKRYYAAETDKIETMNETADWLIKNIAGESSAAFIHNDYKYDNLVLNPNNLSEILAVLDWEMATIGDPLMDLGTTLGYWAEKDDSPALKSFCLTAIPGNLTRQQVLDRYAEKTGKDIPSFVFYYAFASFKIGVIAQQIYARFKKGYTKDPRFGALIYVIKECGNNGVNAIRLNRISNLNKS